MKSEREIRFAESIVESALKQRAGAADCLFRRLTNKNNRPRPLIFQFL